MSVQSEIDRISSGVANAYSVLEGLGATMPKTRNIDNLASTIGTIESGSGGDEEGVITASDFVVSDPLLKYFSYALDTPNKTITLYKIFYDRLYADNGSYDVTIPDTLGTYNVVILSNG